MGANRQSSVRRAQNRINFSGYFSISLFLKPEHVFSCPGAYYLASLLGSYKSLQLLFKF